MVDISEILPLLPLKFNLHIASLMIIRRLSLTSDQAKRHPTMRNQSCSGKITTSGLLAVFFHELSAQSEHDLVHAEC